MDISNNSKDILVNLPKFFDFEVGLLLCSIPSEAELNLIILP